MTKVEELIEQARALSPESQLELYDALSDIINPPDPEWVAAWSVECDRRIAEFERGEVEAEEFDIVMERLRQKYQLK